MVTLNIYWYRSNKRTIGDVNTYGGDLVEYYYIFSDLGLIKQDESIIFPIKKVMFENMLCPCPNNMKKYLEANYGYLESDYKFDNNF